MPAKGKRDYQAERKYDGKPEVKARRAARNRARRAYEKEHGPVPAGYDIDHKKELSSGGSATKLSNLRAVPASKNRSYPRKKDGSMK